MKESSTYKIGAYTIVAILVTLIGTTSVLFTPYITVDTARHDAWITPFTSFLLGLYVIFVCCWLGSIFPDKGFIEYLPLIMGKFMGKLIGFGYILFFLWFTVTVLAEALALLFGIGIFRLTPELTVGLLLLIATTYAVSYGIECISRSIWYVWIITVVFFAAAVFMAAPMVNLSILQPVGESGLSAILKSGLLSHAFKGEMLFLVILFPYVHSRRDALAGGIIALVLLTIFISLTIVLCITIMGVETTARSYFSIFSLGDYLDATGIKIVLATTWILIFWGKVTLGQFALTIGLSQLCGFNSNRALILPVAMLLLILSQVFYPSATDLFSHVGDSFPGLALFTEYLIPGLLLLVAVIRQKLGQLDNQAQQVQAPPASQS